MSTPQIPMPGRLVIGAFMSDKELLDPVVKKLMALYGPLDMVSPWFSFDQTRYYEKESGWPLFRRLLVFSTPFATDGLPEVKLATNRIEAEYVENDKRPVNIDPGYLTLERFVLATGKNFLHRIYLGKGIYADLTLLFKNGEYSVLEWTYPDYAEKEIRDFLGQLRKKMLICARIEKQIS